MKGTKENSQSSLDSLAVTHFTFFFQDSCENLIWLQTEQSWLLKQKTGQADPRH